MLASHSTLAASFVSSSTPHLHLSNSSAPRSHSSDGIVTSIPNELIDYIVDFLHGDVKALLACSLTSKSFRLSAAHHLFASLTLRAEPAGHLGKDLPSFFQIAVFVRTIHVHWRYASQHYNPMPLLSQPQILSIHSPLLNLTSITHDSISYASQGRSTTEFLLLLIGSGGANTLTHIHLRHCRFPSLAALTCVLDSCAALETFVVRTMYLDSFQRSEAASHQLHSQHLRVIHLSDLSGELDYLIKWLASRPVLPPLHEAISPSCHDTATFFRAIRQFSPSCRLITIEPPWTVAQ